jgi:hypothetical protein
LRRAERVVLLVLVVLVGAALLASTVCAAFRAYRLDRFGVLVDARILDSDMGCFGAYGSGSGLGSKSTITYTVEFPYAGAAHRTKVRRPCDVIPPGFGRGRGRIWVQYDRDDPDRIRVQNDDRDRTVARNTGVGLVAYASGGARDGGGQAQPWAGGSRTQRSAVPSARVTVDDLRTARFTQKPVTSCRESVRFLQPETGF